MNVTTSPSPAIVLPSDAPVVTAFGDCATFHLTGAQTGGRYTMLTSISPPGGGPPPHRHENEDECFLVQAGRAEFFKEGVWTEVPVGTSVFMPRGSVHSFRNAGDTPLTLLVVTSPAGFETFFTRCATEFGKSEGPDMAAIMGIAAEHGISFP